MHICCPVQASSGNRIRHRRYSVAATALPQWRMVIASEGSALHGSTTGSCELGPRMERLLGQICRAHITNRGSCIGAVCQAQEGEVRYPSAGRASLFCAGDNCWPVKERNCKLMAAKIANQLTADCRGQWAISGKFALWRWLLWLALRRSAQYRLRRQGLA
jgi:hypothetical protein